MKWVGRMTHPLLTHYIKLTEFLGHALGPDYEVALHDLTDKNRSIIAIANAQISGRKVGAPLTNMALQILMHKSYEHEDYKLHYRGISANGKSLRSSTLFIKDGEQLIGMLCVNFDDSRYRNLNEVLLGLCHPDTFVRTNFSVVEKENSAETTAERFHNSIDAIAADAVARLLQELALTANRLTPEERLQIIIRLEGEGIFLLKGAVKDVAEALGCSSASVYRYLSQLKNDDE